MSELQVELPPQLRQSLVEKLKRNAARLTNPTVNGLEAEKEKEEDAGLILGHILDCGKCASEKEVEDMVDQFIGGMPLAYITGLHSFGPLVLVVRPPVYIPRVETEQWVLLLAAHILSSTPPTPIIRILDICSGTGCIPLLLAQQGGGRIHTVGLDVDDRALTIARENIKRNQLDQVSSFEKFDLFEDDVPALRERLGAFDVVISNPPYVSSADMRKVEGKWPEGNFALQGKLKTESTNGDAGDDDGLSFYRRIHDIYTSLLSPDRPSAIPKLVLEVGSTQSPPVKAMYEGEGRQEVHKETARRKDLSTPKLEEGDTIGTERCIWIYDR